MIKYGSRKFLLAVASLGVNAWLLAELLIDADTLVKNDAAQ